MEEWRWEENEMSGGGWGNSQLIKLANHGRLSAPDDITGTLWTAGTPCSQNSLRRCTRDATVARHMLSPTTVVVQAVQSIRCVRVRPNNDLRIKWPSTYIDGALIHRETICAKLECQGHRFSNDYVRSSLQISTKFCTRLRNVVGSTPIVSETNRK